MPTTDEPPFADEQPGARRVVLLLSITRGGTHLVTDVLLSAPMATLMLDGALVWPLAQGATTRPCDSPIRQGAAKGSNNPGYAFCPERFHDLRSDAPSFAELLDFVCHDGGRQEAPMVRAEAAYRAYLDRHGSPVAIIANRFTYSMAHRTVAYGWTHEDARETLGAIFRFHQDHTDVKLSVLILLRDPYSVDASFRRAFKLDVTESNHRLQSFAGVVEWARNSGVDSWVVRYEDLLEDFDAFAKECKRRWGLDVSRSFSLVAPRARPGRIPPEIRDTVRCTIFGEYYDLESSRGSGRLKTTVLAVWREVQLMLLFLGGRESEGAAAAVRSLHPRIILVIRRTPGLRRRFARYVEATRWKARAANPASGRATRPSGPAGKRQDVDGDSNGIPH